MPIDLKRHNLIEASAGTGKTHAIEEIVLRLLTEEGATLEQILVVTFTEKATGELKSRLRAKLEKNLSQFPEQGVILRQSLDAFDQAPIFTIHGFCQRLLREFPLEQGQEFDLDLVGTRELLRPALREVQRFWPDQFKADLPDLLVQAEYQGAEASKWEEKLLKVANEFKPAWDHSLLPQGDKPAEGQTASWLTARTVQAVMEQVAKVQERRGLYTFDDMIVRVAHALDEKKNAAAGLLVERLRQRYRFAIVDEFQDTDRLQWGILRRLFLEGDKQRLFLVGDPKQAIFGFRGADLETYHKAHKELKENPQARFTSLPENWRSSPSLLEGLNQVFQSCGWFSGEYLPVHPCPADQARYKIDHDATNTAAINLVNLTECDTLGEARKMYGRFVAAEITRLLSAPENFRFLAKEKHRALEPGDIAILVRKRGETPALIWALRERGIPFTFYKETGLWQSAEALQIGYVLEALARPEERRSFHRLLLSRFFRYPPQNLMGEDFPDHHPTRLLFLEWLRLAEDRAWSHLFASLLEDSAILPEAERDRPLANLRHLLGLLQHAAYRDGLDIHGLLSFFRRQKLAPDAEEGDYHPIETQLSKVQILTVHASKGLEYPIVFLAGGYTCGQPGKFAKYYDEPGGKIFQLEPDEEAKQRQKEEEEKEDCRLLYVALTRPIFKLYLPYLPSKEEKKGLRSPGPACLRLRPALDQAGLPGRDDAIAKMLPPRHPSSLGIPSRLRLTTAKALPPLVLEGDLFPSLDRNLARRRVVMASFTSLKRQADREQEVFFGDKLERWDEDETATLAEPDPLRGAEFGDLVHRVLEEIDWGEVEEAGSSEDLWKEGTAARRLIDREVRLTLPKLRTRSPVSGMEAACRRLVEKMVWLALKTPLYPLGGPLCKLPARDCLREVEFLFPDGRQRLEEGFLTGFIDLIFRKEGRYYLLDWKTNLLDGYDPATLERAMKEADYTRQYRLYGAALSRWLGRIQGKKFSVEDYLGGVFYLYLRGLNGRDDGEGVFFVRPKERELDIDGIVGGLKR